MSRSRSFKIIFLATIAVSVNACHMDDINQYGDRCRGWQYIKTDDINCTEDNITECSKEIQDAFNAGACPQLYGVCTFDKDGVKICSVGCQAGKKMCNGVCVNKDVYDAANREKRSDGGEFCTIQCPDKCVNECDEYGQCNKIQGCVNGWDNNDNCYCPEECVNTCNANGTCKCRDECSNGCDEFGECCPEYCENGCKSGGICQCPKDQDKDCSNGCDANGHACCDEKCKNGCDLDGNCSCPGNCRNGCNENGTCKASEGCLNGVDENGVCKCPDNCKNGCDTKGESCLCPPGCQTCDGDGDKCTCTPSCVEANLCDSRTGLCNCLIPKCKNGCDITGDCDVLCESVQCLGENEDCQVINGEAVCVDLCMNVYCKDDYYCNRGKCLEIDSNHNHMYDREETSPKQNMECRTYADCDSEPGKGDGFCDSVIGYKCSTRCTSDEQCIPHTRTSSEPFDNYICRKGIDGDGRCTPDSFISVWNITADDLTLEIPHCIHSPCNHSECYYSIDWGDENSQFISDCNDAKHSYTKPGHYTVIITGTLIGYGYASYHYAASTNRKLEKVISFGPIIMSNSNIFAFTKNFTLSQIDIPNPKSLNLQEMFSQSEFNQPIDNWDTSSVQNMSSLFSGNTKFNQSIEHWDLSEVLTIGSIFSGATAFNQPIDWDAPKLIDMNNMFNGATAFNSAIKVNLNNITNLSNMFDGASSFNQPIEDWDTSKIINMNSMFRGASAFNQPLEKWDTSKVEKMNNMFQRATAFNQPLEKWDTSEVTDMSYMFDGARKFNQPLEKWDTSKVTNMSFMFQGATAFNQSLNNWKTSNVTKMQSMFLRAAAFNQPLNNWDTSKVTTMQSMFSNAKAFDQDLSSWNVNATVSSMFSKSALSQENYCKILASDSWTNKPTMTEYTCDAQN